jgi:hypothetical protein
MKNGFYKSMSMADYHAADGLSKSALSDLAISPAHYKARKLEPKTFEAANLGTAVHMLVLEPERAETQIVTPPTILLGKNGAMSTNACKDWVALEQAKGSIILKADEYDQAQYMRDAVIGHPRYEDLLTGGHAEVSCFYTDQSGLTCKSRPDYLNDEYITDLKTTIDASPEGFGKQAYNLKYYWSAYHSNRIVSCLGAGKRRYIFLCVEKTPPFSVAIYWTPQELIDFAQHQIEPLYALYKSCIELDIWKGYSEEFEMLEIPQWAKKKMEN